MKKDSLRQDMGKESKNQGQFFCSPAGSAAGRATGHFLGVSPEKQGIPRKILTGYYLFGLVQGERKSPGTGQYRFGYQGQYAKKDSETGWSAFGLRMYDPVIARFLSLARCVDVAQPMWLW